MSFVRASRQLRPYAAAFALPDTAPAGLVRDVFAAIVAPLGAEELGGDRRRSVDDVAAAPGHARL